MKDQVKPDISTKTCCFGLRSFLMASIATIAFLGIATTMQAQKKSSPAPEADDHISISSSNSDPFTTFIRNTSNERVNVEICFVQPADDVSWPCSDGFHKVSLRPGQRETVPTILHGDNPVASNPGSAWVAACFYPIVPTNVRLPKGRNGFNYSCTEDSSTKDEFNPARLRNTAWKWDDTSNNRLFTLRFDDNNGVIERVKVQGEAGEDIYRGTWTVKYGVLIAKWNNDDRIEINIEFLNDGRLKFDDVLYQLVK